MAKLKISDGSGTDFIMKHLNDGFFLFDKSGTIQDQVSVEANRLFGQMICGKKFADVLPLPDGKKTGVKSWIEMAFAGQMDFESLLPVAPKTFEVGGRIVALSYKPIFASTEENAQLLLVACTAADKTEEIRLREKAESEFTLVQVIMSAVTDRTG